VGDVLLLAMWLENIMENVEAEKEEQEYSRDWANSGCDSAKYSLGAE
jgi:hypothetical protein